MGKQIHDALSVGIVAVIALAALVSMFYVSNTSSIVTGEATKSASFTSLKLDGSPCTDYSECSSGVCGVVMRGKPSVCVSAWNDPVGAPCGFVQNKTGRLAGMYGNDRECRSSLCGVSSISPQEMACETPRAGRTGTPCGRNDECALALCVKFPGQFIGKCR